MSTKAVPTLTVKHTRLATVRSVQGAHCWGITDGKKWFFYGYDSQHAAETIRDRIVGEVAIRVNISLPAPVSLVK